jgi:hypothetical protein
LNGFGAAARAAAFATLLLAQGCSGPSIGREGADGYFREHRAAFEQVVEQARLCQPETGRIDLKAGFSCTSHQSAQNLELAIARANAKWIRVYYETQSGRRTLAAVDIAVRSDGMAFAGVIEEFIFISTPALHAEYERNDDGIAIVERQPVTEPPHHWYWRKIDR